MDQNLDDRTPPPTRVRGVGRQQHVTPTTVEYGVAGIRRKMNMVMVNITRQECADDCTLYNQYLHCTHVNTNVFI